MHPTVTIQNVEPTGPSESHVTFRMELGREVTEFTVIANVYREDGPGRHPFVRDGNERWIGVTGTSPVMADALALALARRERGEYDSVTTDNVVQGIFRKPLLRLRNWRVRRAA